MTRWCGGCEGLGSHWRWCPVSVGPAAHHRGVWADRAEALGDSVGPNEMGAANHLWTAAALLREAAVRERDQWRAQNDKLSPGEEAR